jgi:hypothetical protein
MNEEIFDVILLSTGNFRADLQTFQEHRPPQENFYLDEQMWVGHLPKGISSNLVFDACDSPGWHFYPARQYGMRYAFCRKVEPENGAYYHWDHDQTIPQSCFHALSDRPRSAHRFQPGCISQATSLKPSFQVRLKATARARGSWPMTIGGIGSRFQS